MCEKNLFYANNDEANTRLDIFLALKLANKNISRSQVKNYIDKNAVLVNKKIEKAGYKIKTNDEIIINFSSSDISLKPEKINLDIIYEDSEIIIINKPQNMIVHPGAGNFSGTLVNGLLYYFKNNLSDINGISRPGIVHRIDKNTSGILVVAKNNYTHNFLAGQFAEHKITREYMALVHGNLYENGTINKPIGRSSRDRKKMAINLNGRKAITHYYVLKNFVDYCLIKLKLETGRTHQIRVHMASINHPVLGDEIYGTGNKKFNLIGQVLHAKKLGFVHPKTKKYVEFNQSPPKYFLDLIRKLNAGV